LGAENLPVCPICNARRVKFVGRPQISPEAAPFVREDYRIAKCNSCIFYFVFPEIKLKQEEWAELYGKKYFSEISRWWKNKRKEHREKRLGLLQKYSPRKVIRFLDIGCGEGYVLADAQEKGWEVYGVDIYDNRLDIAKSSDIFFFGGDIFHASFPADFFDCIYLDSVLEHLKDPVALLKEAHRILCPGGVLYLGVPNEDSLYNDVRKLVATISGRRGISVRTNPFRSPYHVVGFTLRSIKKTLVENGFDIVRLRNFSGEYEWRKFKLFTRPSFIHFFLLPVYLIAIPLKRRMYIDAIIRKRGS
jgi:SAM-dependent methyltransferase